MRYRLNQTNYANFDVYEQNKLPGRSYFIPYPDRASADAVSPKEKRYRSPKVVCLNGEWDFKFYPIPAELPEVLDTDEVAFDRVQVPGCWQFQGYDHPFYVNIRYQFPFKPPMIPTTEKVGRVFSWLGVDQKVSLRWKQPENEYNFVGVYRRFVTIEDASKRLTLSFLGVASCLDLYVNGNYVGYSEGAHNTAEFDLTGMLHAGSNELVAVVHRWCTGSYLEDQDMFRNNGIFRDVLLRIDEKTDCWDIDAKTVRHGDTYSLTLSAITYEDTTVTFRLSGHGLQESRTVRAQQGVASVTFEHLTVTEWNAEEPTLYTIHYETESSCIREQIGFKTVEIKGDVLLVNGRRIKCKGVNHHDTSPRHGYTMSPDEIERDVLLCKQFNMDTIRTSHYPPDPLLLELADLYGLYVVDENDLETHGTFAMQLSGSYNSLSHDPRWEPRYVDRISRLYQRDKLHACTCILIWSLGNEAGGYRNTDAMYRYLKAHSDLPVHYESAVHCKRIAYDVGSEMYPTPQMVHDVGEHCRKQKPLNDRPYFMCEYAHAMGVGPGNVEAYWQEVYRYDNLMGGCVWEMVDHAVQHTDGSLTYGGDHGEWEHDGNFCCDGLFYPDRKPSTGAWVMRYIYRPIRVRHVEGRRFEIFNTTSFSPGERYRLVFLWNDGTRAELVSSAAPLDKVCVTLEASGQPVQGVLTLQVLTVDTRTGRQVSEEQLVLSQLVPSRPALTRVSPDTRFAVEHGILSVRCGDACVMTTAQESTLLYRAPTDNDTNPFFANTMAPYAAQKERVLRCERTDHGYCVVTRVSNRKARFLVTDTYEFCHEGLLLTSRIHCVRGGGILPRFGKCFRLDSAFDAVSYTGRMGESYADMKEQFLLGRVDCAVADMTEPNIRPQESGNRCDCTEVHLSNGRVRVSLIAVDKPFELSVKPYTDRELMGMKHREDEHRTGTYVTVQAFQQGIGTGACGPGIAKEFTFSARKDVELKVLIRVDETD